MIKESELLPRETKDEVPASGELAWLIGFFCASGHIDKVKKAIHFSSPNGYIRYGLFSKIESLFNVAASEHFSNSSRRLHRSPRIYAQVPNIDQVLGDLRLKEWPATVKSKHEWILSNDNYLWQFVSGFFEGKGIVSNPFVTKDYHFMLQAKDEAAIHFLSTLLKSLGFSAISQKTRHGAAIAVVVYGIEDVQKLALNIHSLDQDKEAILNEYRFLPGRVHSNPQILQLYEEVWKLRYEEQKTYEEIAAVDELQKLGLTYGLVKSWLSGGRHPYHANMSFDFEGRKQRRLLSPDWQKQKTELTNSYAKLRTGADDEESIYVSQYVDRFADTIDGDTNLDLLSSVIATVNHICLNRNSFDHESKLGQFCFDIIYANTPEELIALYLQFNRYLLAQRTY